MNYIKKIFIYILFLNTSNAFEEKFHICGSYCGPNWCNNKWLSEDKCDTSVEPEYHNLTGYSCADICCGQNKTNQKSCNKEIVNCLKKCNPLSLTCTLDFIPVPAGTIELAMDIVEDWCCGSPC
tara:strand:- start:73 stop:444 length:372 start_codon:yes stop_codon:yes gene_type:complete